MGNLHFSSTIKQKKAVKAIKFANNFNLQVKIGKYCRFVCKKKCLEIDVKWQILSIFMGESN